MPAAMPCKIRRGTCKETCRTPDAPKTKYACIAEADEPTWKRLDGTLHERSWRPNCRDKNQFIEPLLSCAHIYSFASSSRTDMGEAIGESSFGTRLEKSSKLGVFVRKTKKKGLFLPVYVDDIKPAGQKQNIDPMWKVPMKEVDVGEPTFLNYVYFSCTRMSNKQRYWRQLQKCLRIQNICLGDRKTTLFGEAWRKHVLLVLWYGR